MKPNQFVHGAAKEIMIASIEIHQTFYFGTKRLSLPKKLKNHGGKDRSHINEQSAKAVRVISRL
jgi:hypothetical protein